VLLLHLDGKLPNLALMRLAAHHRAVGDEVELRQTKTLGALERRFGDPASWDRVYASLIFQSSRLLGERVRQIYPNAAIGGTGWDVMAKLADVGVDDGPLDYSDYPKWQQSIGFAMRGCRLRCEFCVVPKKEGKARSNATIAEIWRGDPWPRQLLLLDNDFFGNPNWRSVLAEVRDGGFKLSLSQGINARMLNDETAEAIASVDYRDDQMDRKRIYTAWDSKGDERVLFRGLEALARAGVKPDHIMVYMLVGFWPGETHADRDHRRARLRAFGARPYPMPYTRDGELGRELVAFQRWVVQRHDQHIPWERWTAARGSPRLLGARRVSLPLFPPVEHVAKG
jgi:hypothetical protein